jgi:Hint domain
MVTTTLLPLAVGGYDTLGIFFDGSTAAMTESFVGANEVEFATFALTPDQISGIDNGSLTVTLHFDTTTSDVFSGQMVFIGATALTNQQASLVDDGAGGQTARGLIANVAGITDYPLQAGLPPFSQNIGYGTKTFFLDGLFQNETQLSAAAPDVVISSQLSGGTIANLNNVVLIISCYAAGSLILTERGETKVEFLAEGETVKTIEGDRLVDATVKWIGYRTIDLTKHPRPEQAAPVRIRAGAFAPGKPHTDLLLSPDHSVYIGGRLVPIRRLINGATIVGEYGLSSVTYYHVELERHALLLANGLEAESYLDTGNRAIFENAGLALLLHPDMSVAAGVNAWNVDSCAPLAVADEEVEPLWRELAARADMLGWVRPVQVTMDDPDLHLRVDGRSIRPIAIDGLRYLFVLPAGASDVHLQSRVSNPADRPAWLEDIRRLGVAVRRLVVQTGGTMREIPVDDPALADGWHAVERDDAVIWRWTDGGANVPVGSLEAPAILEIEVGICARYPTVFELAA